ncbi:hypothetical protein YC2023_005694 [Brassica napus]
METVSQQTMRRDSINGSPSFVHVSCELQGNDRGDWLKNLKYGVFELGNRQYVLGSVLERPAVSSMIGYTTLTYVPRDSLQRSVHLAVRVWDDLLETVARADLTRSDRQSDEPAAVRDGTGRINPQVCSLIGFKGLYVLHPLIVRNMSYGQIINVVRNCKVSMNVFLKKGLMWNKLLSWIMGPRYYFESGPFIFNVVCKWDVNSSLPIRHLHAF